MTFAKHVIAAVAAGAGVLASQQPAHAGDFSATYACSVQGLGTRNVTVNGTLNASPDRSAVGRPIRISLHVSGLSLRSPVALESWSAAAGVEVAGAQNGTLRVAGSGGSVPAREPVSVDLGGVWTPRVRGVDRLRTGSIVIRAKARMIGNVTGVCTPAGSRPYAETVVVGSSR